MPYPWQVYKKMNKQREDDRAKKLKEDLSKKPTVDEIVFVGPVVCLNSEAIICALV